MNFLNLKSGQVTLLNILQWLPDSHRIKLNSLVCYIIFSCFGFYLLFSSIICWQSLNESHCSLRCTISYIRLSISLSPTFLSLLSILLNDIINHSNPKSHNRLFILSPSIPMCSNLPNATYERDSASYFTKKATPCKFLVLYIPKGRYTIGK